jgi:HlyD family secretion protein
MRTIHLLSLLIIILLSSCSGKNDKSDAYGTFEATEVTISSEMPGKIISLAAEEGTEIKAGDEVGLIDTTDLQLKRQSMVAQLLAVSTKLDGISAQLSVQEQQKENLLIEKRRLDQLFADKAATQKQLDDMNGNLKLIDKQLHATAVQKESVNHEQEALRQQIAQIVENISKCHIVNPIEGIVLAKYMEAGEIALAGKPLYKIADLREMDIRVYVSGTQLPHIKLGQQAEVLIDEDKTKNRKLSGTVKWISSTAEFTPKIIQTKEERVNLVYAVKVRVKNDGSLKIAMPGEVKF